jgi:dihydroorotase
MSFVEQHMGPNRELAGIAMPRPSDFHAHFRKSPMLDAVLPHQISWVKYALAMPNTQPITTLREAEDYWEQLKAVAAKHGHKSVEFVMTLYYTARVTAQVVEHISTLPFKLGVKAYPPHKGATTGSGAGVPILSMPETLRSMEVNGVRLLIHGESVIGKDGNELPHEEREGEFMREVFPQLRERYPDLLICLEHISTVEGIEAVKSDDSGNTVSTITPHHAICSTEDFGRSWANHLRCMPIPKAPHHRDAIREFMTGGDKRVILGTDTAPHPSMSKVGKDGGLPFNEAACGCYLPHAIALYALVFKEMGKLDERFAKFACFNGPDWWNLPRPKSTDRIHIRVEHENDIPEPTPVPEIDDIVIPLGWTKEPDKMRIGLAHVLQSEHAH